MATTGAGDRLLYAGRRPNHSNLQHTPPEDYAEPNPVSIGSLIRICQTLSISSDSILFGEEIENDVHGISDRLSKLPSEQFEIAVDIMNKLFEAFASSGK